MAAGRATGAKHRAFVNSPPQNKTLKKKKKHGGVGLTGQRSEKKRGYRLKSRNVCLCSEPGIIYLGGISFKTRWRTNMINESF